MTAARFEVSGMPGTSTCTVKLNGEEIQNAVQGLTIRGRCNAPFEVELDVVVFKGLHFETSEADVIIPDSTCDLLIKLGWTPPKETP